jgi:hypothetical protein
MVYRDLMRDPFYAGIVFTIEQKINEGDQIAGSKGIVLTDSQVVSVLTKVIGAAEGKPAKMPVTSNPRDEFLAELREKLNEVRESIFEAESDQDPADAKPLPTADWVLALRCTIESARLRKGSMPGSRDYLNYLGPFIAEATRRNPPPA